MKYFTLLLFFFLILIISSCETHQAEEEKSSTTGQSLSAVNDEQIPRKSQLIAITGATIIDGLGGPAITDGCVIIRDDLIDTVGKISSIKIPEDAEIIDASGLCLLPGLIDAHFHLNGQKGHANHFLKNGITSLRDPGAWIEDYEIEMSGDYPLPRLFLTGPHLDMFPPAYPENSYILHDPDEARKAVQVFADQGASAIKVYFRLSLGLIKEICNTAHEIGIPVTAHLEVTDAKDAIVAGLDGIEHITSFGTSLSSRYQAEKYRQAVLADNNARRQGRYEVWNSLDINDEKADELIAFLVEKGTYVCPTLGAFEYHLDDQKKDTIREKGFEKMMAFTGKAYQGGVRIVLGSHSAVPYAERGWAYHHEMELLAACGMNTMDIITASTMENARFFRVEKRLGSIEKGKIADLILVEGNPINDISDIRKIKKVMINGIWVE